MKSILILSFALVGIVQSATAQKANEAETHPALLALITWAESHKNGKTTSDQEIFLPNDLKALKEEMGNPKADVKGKLSQAVLEDQAKLSFKSDAKVAGTGVIFMKDTPVFPMALKNKRWLYDPKGAEKLMAKNKISGAKRDMASLISSLQQYRNLAGHYPSEKQGLRALLTKPTTPPRPRKWVKMMGTAKSLNDPWGNPYQYKLLKDGPVITSLGPDGKASDDDVSSK
jgi:type II secretion system protein G